MAEKTFDQDFIGYQLENRLNSLTTDSGVYGVYRCTYNKDKDTVSLKQLIYIGKADDLKDRLNNHEKINDWKGYLKNREVLCFCYTLIDTYFNERVEATLINSNQPPENTEYKRAFPFDKTTVNCSGKHKFIMNVNIINRN